jgi:hypothetical protein
MLPLQVLELQASLTELFGADPPATVGDAMTHVSAAKAEGSLPDK